MNPETLKLLRCVSTGQPLSVLDDPSVEELNEAIVAGKVVNRAGETMTRPLSGALLNADRTLCYPIVDGIPVLIGDEAIEWSGGTLPKA